MTPSDYECKRLEIEAHREVLRAAANEARIWYLDTRIEIAQILPMCPQDVQDGYRDWDRRTRAFMSACYVGVEE